MRSPKERFWTWNREEKKEKTPDFGLIFVILAFFLCSLGNKKKKGA